MRVLAVFLLFGLFGVALITAPIGANDWDGPTDCTQIDRDFGDAPECVDAYPSGVVGQFPTCETSCGQGTQENGCPPISTPPGPTGFVRHIHPHTASFPSYWLGNYFNPVTLESGIDNDPDGKTNTPPTGISACNPAVSTDCTESAWGMSWDQDEAWGDGSDTGVITGQTLVACQTNSIQFTTYLCDTNPHTVYLNILVDFNEDGDWNDSGACDPVNCAYEWAVKNVPITLPPGGGSHVSPAFFAGPDPGHAWMRVSLTEDAVTDDWPWAGTANYTAGEIVGGETEDYPVDIDLPTQIESSTWGKLKAHYR